MLFQTIKSRLKSLKTSLTPPTKPESLSDLYGRVVKRTVLTPSVFLEIGSRDGLDAMDLAHHFRISPSNVHIVEANPFCAEQIRASFPDFKVYEMAIFNQNGSLYFNQIEGIESGVSSLKDRFDNYYDSRATKITVPTITGEAFLKQSSIETVDICKIDVEGCTLEVLQSFGDKLKNIKSKCT